MGRRRRQSIPSIGYPLFPNLSEEQSNRFSAIIAKAPAPPNLVRSMAIDRKVPLGVATTRPKVAETKHTTQLNVDSEIRSKIREGLEGYVPGAGVRERSIKGALLNQGRLAGVDETASDRLSMLPSKAFENRLDRRLSIDKHEEPKPTTGLKGVSNQDSTLASDELRRRRRNDS